MSGASSSSSILRKPASHPIAPFPKSSTAKAVAAPKYSGMWPAGLRVEKDWLKEVRKPHDRMKYKVQTGLVPTVCQDSSMRPVTAIPPPIADVLTPEGLLQQWNARWLPENVEAADWRAERMAPTAAVPAPAAYCSRSGASSGGSATCRRRPRDMVG